MGQKFTWKQETSIEYPLATTSASRRQAEALLNPTKARLTVLWLSNACDSFFPKSWEGSVRGMKCFWLTATGNQTRYQVGLWNTDADLVRRVFLRAL